MLENLNLGFVGWEAYWPGLGGENALGMVDEAMPLLLWQRLMADKINDEHEEGLVKDQNENVHSFQCFG